MDDNYHLEMFLRECKYTEKEGKVFGHITDDLENSFDDSDEFYEK